MVGFHKVSLLGLHDLAAVVLASGSIFLLLPFGAGAILGVYVTVLVTTSRICRMLDLESFFACLCGLLVLAAPPAGALAAVVGVSGSAGRFKPGDSANRRDLSAASQSNAGDLTEAVLSGDLGE